MTRLRQIVRIASLLPLLAGVLLAGGCGYHFTGEGAGPRQGLKSIAIPVFENKTSEPELGSLFAGVLRKEFLRKGGNIQVVSEEQADVVLRGRIMEIYTSAVAHRDVEQTIESRLYLTLEVRVEDIRNGGVIWQDPHFTYHRVFRQSQDGMTGFDNRRQAIDLLAREMAVRIHDRFLSNF